VVDTVAAKQTTQLQQTQEAQAVVLRTVLEQAAQPQQIMVQVHLGKETVAEKVKRIITLQAAAVVVQEQ
jgi:hypothetical protein